MKLVVTGPLGHIGSRLIRDFAKSFPRASVVLIDNLATQRYASLLNLPSNLDYFFFEQDVSAVDIDDSLQGAKAVVHLAALTDAASSFAKADEVKSVNLSGTERVAKACLRENVPMIFASSTSVYGSQSECVVEDDPKFINPQSPYGATKTLEEALILDLVAQGLSAVICRFGTICGPSIGMRFHTAINKFIWQAFTQQPVSVWSTALHQRRPYLHLDDCVSAINFLIENEVFDGEIYNVLTENLTVSDVLKSIQKHITNIKVSYVDHEIMNQLSYEVSNEKLKKLGFQYCGSIDNGVAETFNWMPNLIRAKV